MELKSPALKSELSPRLGRLQAGLLLPGPSAWPQPHPHPQSSVLLAQRDLGPTQRKTCSARHSPSPDALPLLRSPKSPPTCHRPKIPPHSPPTSPKKLHVNVLYPQPQSTDTYALAPTIPITGPDGNVIPKHVHGCGANGKGEGTEEWPGRASSL